MAVTLRCQETVSLLDSNIPLFTAAMTFLAGGERSPADFVKQMLGDPRSNYCNSFGIAQNQQI